MQIGRPYSRLLSRLDPSNSLSPRDQRRISELPFKVTGLEAGQEVTHQGDAPSRCTLLLQGFLYSHKPTAGLRRQVTSFLVPGDMADLQTLYLRSLDHSLSALGPAVVAFLPHAALKAIFEASPQLTQAFWRETFLEAAIFREWITNLGRREAIARVAHVICELAVRLQAVDLVRDFCFSMPWTQSDLADACGISSVHANRVVQELRRLGLVDWEPKQISIRNWEGLIRIGDFSTEYLQIPSAPESGVLAHRTPQRPLSDNDASGARRTIPVG
jgi:CRP-like cAMP-binding protein